MYERHTRRVPGRAPTMVAVSREEPGAWPLSTRGGRRRGALRRRSCASLGLAARATLGRTILPHAGLGTRRHDGARRRRADTPTLTGEPSASEKLMITARCTPRGRGCADPAGRRASRRGGRAGGVRCHAARPLPAPATSGLGAAGLCGPGSSAPGTTTSPGVRRPEPGFGHPVGAMLPSGFALREWIPRPRARAGARPGDGIRGSFGA